MAQKQYYKRDQNLILALQESIIAKKEYKPQCILWDIRFPQWCCCIIQMSG